MVGTDSIVALRVFVERAAALGVDAAALWAAARISPELTRDPNVRVESDRFAEMVERAMELGGFPDIHVRVQELRLGRAGNTLAYAIAGSENLGDAVLRFLGHVPVWTDAMIPSWELRESCLHVRLAATGARRPGTLWRLAGGLGSVVVQTGALLPAPWVPLDVKLEVPEPADVSVLRRILGPNIAFDQPITELRIRAADLDVRCTNPDLGRVPSIDALIDSPQGAVLREIDDLVDVRHALVTLLPGGAPTMPELADRMGLTTAELHARLARGATDYRRLLDELRAKVARSLLRSGETSLTEMAMLSGYRDVSAFRRAFKRWTGETAGRTRRQNTPAVSTPEVGVEPTTSLGLVSLVVGGAARFGASTKDLWEIAGVDPDAPGEPFQRIPSRRFHALIEAAARLTGHEDVCLRIRENLDITVYGVFGFAMATSADVFDMFRRLHRFLAFWDEVDLSSERCRGGLLVGLRSHAPPSRGRDLHVAAVMGNNLIQGRRLARHDLRVHSVKLPGAPPASLEVYERVFRCDIAFGAPTAELVVPEDELARPLAGPRPEAADLAGRYLAEHLERSPREPEAVRETRASILSLLPSHEARIELVAHRLRTSVRTLQRRLTDAGRRFEDLVDDVRRELCLEHVRAGDRNLAEVAFAAGFSDPSAFYRAFRRWTGMSPVEWRARST